MTPPASAQCEFSGQGTSCKDTPSGPQLRRCRPSQKYSPVEVQSSGTITQELGAAVARLSHRLSSSHTVCTTHVPELQPKTVEDACPAQAGPSPSAHGSPTIASR